jgi:hypothetical protein
MLFVYFYSMWSVLERTAAASHLLIGAPGASRTDCT